VYRADFGYSGRRHEDVDAEDVHGEDWIDDAEAFLFHEGREAFMGLDKVDAALFCEGIEGGAELVEGGEAFIEKARASFSR
jgi:hypothetical protein